MRIHAIPLAAALLTSALAAPLAVRAQAPPPPAHAEAEAATRREQAEKQRAQAARRHARTEADARQEAARRAARDAQIRQRQAEARRRQAQDAAAAVRRQEAERAARERRAALGQRQRADALARQRAREMARRQDEARRWQQQERQRQEAARQRQEAERRRRRQEEARRVAATPRPLTYPNPGPDSVRGTWRQGDRSGAFTALYHGDRLVNIRETMRDGYGEYHNDYAYGGGEDRPMRFLGDRPAKDERSGRRVRETVTWDGGGHATSARYGDGGGSIPGDVVRSIYDHGDLLKGYAHRRRLAAR